MKTDLNPSAYDAFAPFYDAFTSASDYEHWTQQVLGRAARHGMAGERVIEPACGTGKSFLPLLSRGYRVTGCDSSAAMLALAAAKAPDAALVQCDLRELPVLGSFDLVTCFDDSLNYLLDSGELLSAFRGIGRNLAAAGLVLFDLNTLRAYRTTFACDSVTEHDGTLFAWRGESLPDLRPGQPAGARLDIFDPGEDGVYERGVSRHEQR